jgi:predicted small secreted protein
MKKLLALVAVSFSFALIGCNTVRGVGQDLQKAGGKIEGAAKK